jgi:hypothetical protein
MIQKSIVPVLYILLFISHEPSQVFAFTLRHSYGMHIKLFRCSFAALLVMLHCLCMLMTSGIAKHCHNDSLLQGGGLGAAQWDWSSKVVNCTEVEMCGMCGNC